MSKTARLIALMALSFSLSPGASAQFKVPPETRNAALRYWLAFGEMQDPSADPGLSMLLKRTADGGIP